MRTWGRCWMRDDVSNCSYTTLSHAGLTQLHKELVVSRITHAHTHRLSAAALLMVVVLGLGGAEDESLAAPSWVSSAVHPCPWSSSSSSSASAASSPSSFSVTPDARLAGVC